MADHLLVECRLGVTLEMIEGNVNRHEQIIVSLQNRCQALLKATREKMFDERRGFLLLLANVAYLFLESD